jgi:hypothetical protein
VNNILRRFAEVLRHPNRYLSQQWINDFMMQARQTKGGSLVIIWRNN